MPQCKAPRMRNRDDESGQYTQSVGDDELIAYLIERDGAGTGDVADRFDYQQPTAYRRLKALESEGRVSARRIGGSLFWQPVGEAEP